jgi:transposase
MQDNAPIHSARVVTDWFTEHEIPVVDWPPYSPDLNPIEHVWWHLKNKVVELHPGLETIGTGEESKDALEAALIEAWGALDNSIIESCLESMPRRRDAVLRAKGWHTKY